MEKDSGKPTFENAIERLEEIVSLMEEGDTPLAELVDQFEEGTKLAKTCNERLQEAESRKNQENLSIEDFSTEED
jgi:exodeoxyribonuclease VII small subunit